MNRFGRSAPGKSRRHKKSFTCTRTSAGVSLNSYDRKMAIDAMVNDRADLVSFGCLFIANPDLVERLRENARSTR